MSQDHPVIASLQRAVDAAPQDIALRMHLAELLVGAGRGSEAVVHCATVLAAQPGHDGAQAFMRRALGGDPEVSSGGTLAAAPGGAPGAAPGGTPAWAPPATPPAAAPPAASPPPVELPSDPSAGDPAPPTWGTGTYGGPAAPDPEPGTDAPEPAAADEPAAYDWSKAEEQVGDIAQPMFVDEEHAPIPDVGA